MDPFTAKSREKTSKSQIPVLAQKVKPSNLASKENEFSIRQSSLTQASNGNKPIKNSLLRKEFMKQSKPQVVKAINDRTDKASNSYKTAAKSSELVKKSSYQVKNAPAIKSCRKNEIPKNTSVSQTSNINKKTVENFHNRKIEYVKKSCSQLEKTTTEKNIKNSKCKFTSSKVNTQTAEKASINSEQIKNVTPKIIFEKENQETAEANCFFTENDMQFEANELFRKMILSGKELSPSVCKIMPGLKLSSVQTQRPSAYQKYEVPANPYQDALQAIANASAKRGNRKFSVLNDRKITTDSPFKERISFYTPCADPKEEVMRSLKEFKTKQMQKSASALKNSKKKVTFNLNVEEYTAKLDFDSEPVPSKSSESRLTQINERSEENTPISPIRNKAEASCVNLENNKHPSEFQESSHMKPTQEILNCQRTIDVLNERNKSEQNVKKTYQSKLCTPRPISFCSNSRFLNDSLSPEYLTEKNFLPASAPIYTPLALKNIAKGSAVSPDSGLNSVKLKLDFTAAEKESPKKENPVKKHVSGTLRKIVTLQKQLDDLADQECGFWLPNESIPVVCGRYLQNPVAVTLAEGDEMHFLPIRL